MCKINYKDKYRYTDSNMKLLILTFNPQIFKVNYLLFIYK